MGWQWRRIFRKTTTDMHTENQIEISIGTCFHEWKTPEARKMLEEAGISERNWALFMRRSGLADGTVWTFAQLANEYGIARPRAHQIVASTRKRFVQYCARIGIREDFVP